MKAKNEKRKVNAGTGLVIGISVIFILIGLALLLVEGFRPTYVIYLASAVMIMLGIIMIVKYGINEGYKNIGRYDFSLGVLGILAGILLIIKANTIAESFFLFLGICILLTAILKLQNAVDLRALDHSGWFIFLILAVGFLVAAVLIILNPVQMLDKKFGWVYILLIVDGAFQLFGTLYLAIVLWNTNRKSVKEKETHRGEDAPNGKDSDVDIVVDAPRVDAEYVEAAVVSPGQTDRPDRSEVTVTEAMDVDFEVDPESDLEEI